MKVYLPYAIFVTVVLGLLSGCSNGTSATPSVSSVVPTLASKSAPPTLTPKPPQATSTTIPSTPTETQPAPTPLDPRAKLQSGMYLVFWMDGSLYLSSLEQPLGIRLASVDYPFARLSPDGSRLVFSSQGELALYEMASGKVTKPPVLQRFNYRPSWSSDGKSLVYVHDDEEMVNSSLYVVNVTIPSPIMK